MNASIRTRFAPSPTGSLHIGGVRTALFNWLFAKKMGGQYILRIEDTDAARNTLEARKGIVEGLSWLGLNWDEGPALSGEIDALSAPYYQSQRQAIYEKAFERLVRAQRVYQEEGAWKFRFERKPITVNDLICGEVTIDYTNEENTPDMVIRRSDGSFVFHFVNVVDDLDMGITHVLRGEDHLMNTPKHLQLIEALGEQAPIYGHIPLILNLDGSKMSKRDAGAALVDYQEKGFLPEAVINFVALMGWSDKQDEREIFSPKELLEVFSLEGVQRSPAKCNIQKALWINQQHLLQLSPQQFEILARPFVATQVDTLPSNFGAMAESVQQKVSVLSEVYPAIAFFFQETFPYEEDALAKVPRDDDFLSLLDSVLVALTDLEDWQEAKSCCMAVAKQQGKKPGKLFFPLRVGLTGRAQGPDLDAILAILGKASVLASLKRFIDLLQTA